MIKLLHGDFGAGAIQTCLKGITKHIVMKKLLCTNLPIRIVNYMQKA